MYYAVVVGFLDPFVDECSGEDTVHVGTVDGGHVSECAGSDGDAAVFAEKGGDGVG